MSAKMHGTAPASDAIKLALDSRQPAYRQIHERLRQRIAEGALRAGERLPSARALASALGVARGTVDAAYAMLAGEGYILGRGAAGTIVAPGLAAATPLPAPEPALERHAYDEARMPRGPDGAPLPFQLGLPALDAFPRTLWTRLAAREARRLAPADMAYPDPRGEPTLRAAIAQYLAIARGITTSPDQILVTSGFQGALGLVTRCLAVADSEVWIEDPGYFLARRALETAGARLVPVPVDEDGLDVAAGIARAPRARLALVTPSHHAPLGMALGLPRRLALLAWATEADSYILEDDYDGEFRYRGHPLPALKSLDRAGRVLYAGTFSKVLLPSLRLGYLVLPEPLLGRFVRLAARLQPPPAPLLQRVVADFIADGHFARHVKRMRGLYAARREALAAALAAEFGERFRITLAAGGMHLLARCADRESDAYLVRLANAAGLAPFPLSEAALEADGGQGLLLGFTNIAAAAAPRIVRRLARALAG